MIKEDILACGLPQGIVYGAFKDIKRLFNIAQKTSLGFELRLSGARSNYIYVRSSHLKK